MDRRDLTLRDVCSDGFTESRAGVGGQPLSHEHLLTGRIARDRTLRYRGPVIRLCGRLQTVGAIHKPSSEKRLHVRIPSMFFSLCSTLVHKRPMIGSENHADSTGCTRLVATLDVGIDLFCRYGSTSARQY